MTQAVAKWQPFGTFPKKIFYARLILAEKVKAELIFPLLEEYVYNFRINLKEN